MSCVYRYGQILLSLHGELVQAVWRVIVSGFMSSRSLEHKFTDFIFHFRSWEYLKALVAHAMSGSETVVHLSVQPLPKQSG